MPWIAAARQSLAVTLALNSLLVILGFASSAHAATTVGITLTMPNNSLGLVGHWTFDGKDMISNVADTSGQGNTGYMVAAATSSQVTPGPIGQALKFNGSTQYVNISNVASLRPTGNFSISAWFKIGSTAAQRYVFDSYSQSPTNVAGIGLGLNVEGASARKIGVISGKNTGAGSVCTTDFCTAVSTTNVDDNRWHFAVGLWDSSLLKLYIDGVLQDTSSWASALVYAAGNQVRIGNLFQASNAAYFSGTIDDVHLYNRALSAAEVMQLYNLGH